MCARAARPRLPRTRAPCHAWVQGNTPKSTHTHAPTRVPARLISPTRVRPAFIPTRFPASWPCRAARRSAWSTWPRSAPAATALAAPPALPLPAWGGPVTGADVIGAERRVAERALPGARMPPTLPTNIDIREPRWDQSTFQGRAKHFFTVTDPRNLLLSGAALDEARRLVLAYRAGTVPPGLTEDELWRAKYIYDSAFHPDTGEKMLLIGRMSAQVPMNMTITGCMMTFYRTTPAVVFWQWVNQSFNAIVNYTNRSGDAPITPSQLGTAYVSATGGAVVTALGLKSLTKHLPAIIGRYVPFAAVAAANCINIPLMRQRELKVGIPITDENGNRLGESTAAAQKAIFQVVVSRIGMAAPAMAIPPVIMNMLEKRAFLKRYPYLNAPLQVGLVGLCLVFATPLCCALFPQKSSMQVSRLEPSVQAQIREVDPQLQTVYFNKGL
ncbi:sideroflexin-3 isoform X1 [Coturnix japonica]|uniref:Sideroflexin-3 n=2 Tax=Coturnix japonica TaxID=93934 RepID=A0A8C2UD68_COTJA|nr:sideroflexin-3 isoform X1 [Coturnix japonica]